MLEVWKEQQPEFYREIKTIIQEKNKPSHAYFIETNGFAKSKELVLSFAKFLLCQNHQQEKENCENCNQCSLIDQGDFFDFKMIEPDGNWIKKEQLLELQDSFKTLSYTSNYRVYVIFQADKLNVSSANTILKFLEEPSENIIGILVANSRYQVLPTILSRCQIYSLKNIQSFDQKVEYVEKVLNFLYFIVKNPGKIMAYQSKFQEEFFSKKEAFQTMLNTLQYLLVDLIEAKENSFSQQSLTEYQYLLNNLPRNDIIKMLELISKLEHDLVFNVNLKLQIDKFLIELNEVII